MAARAIEPMKIVPIRILLARHRGGPRNGAQTAEPGRRELTPALAGAAASPHVDRCVSDRPSNWQGSTSPSPACRDCLYFWKNASHL
jgi:hypothetical protein